MRLLKLRIENINSLAGRYEIDFTNRDYVESGIFAISAPPEAERRRFWMLSHWRFLAKRHAWRPERRPRRKPIAAVWF